MTGKYLATALAVALPALTIAQTPQHYQCAYGDMQRRVQIIYETAVTVPCEVHYYKDTEQPGEHEVLWRALNQEGYCESQAEAFVSQLQEWGWSCDMAAPAEPANDAEKADDTDALAPGKEMGAGEQ